MERKRIFGRHYELARIYVPKKVAQFVVSHARELKNCEGYKVYDELHAQERDARNYEESISYQYLRELFFCLRTDTPIILKVGGEVMAVPTNEIEQRQFPWKDTECVEMSLRVRLEDYQVPIVRQLMAIVEKKMTSMLSDFYFHDMKTVARELGSHPMLWVVGTSHTVIEVHDEEALAKAWVDTDQESRRRHFLYGSEDDTWMGAALRGLCGMDDECYYIDNGGTPHRVSRERFTAIHNDYVERVRSMVKEKIELKAA